MSNLLLRLATTGTHLQSVSVFTITCRKVYRDVNTFDHNVCVRACDRATVRVS